MRKSVARPSIIRILRCGGAIVVLAAVRSSAPAETLAPPFRGAAGAAPSHSPAFFRTIVWKGGEDGIIAYHVPGIYVARGGTVFAYADARYGDPSDFGPHHVVLKRSIDDGKSWSKNQYLGRSDHGEIFLFPNMIQPRESNRLFFFYSEKDPASINTRTFVWLRHSDDDGRTWSVPVAMQDILIRADRELQQRLRTAVQGEFAGENPELYGREQFYTGPGSIIQLRADNPVAPGRILVPVLTIKNRVGPMRNRGMSDTVLYSDDQGATWKGGGAIPMNGIAISEPNIIELENGVLLINARVEDQKRRVVSTSKDGGITWSRARLDTSGIPHHTICFASLRRYSFAADDPAGIGRILYCCPNDPARRRNLSIFVSDDDCRSWSRGRVIDPDYSDYSNMAVFQRQIYLIYGKITQNPKETIFARFNWEWLTDGKDPSSSLVSSGNQQIAMARDGRSPEVISGQRAFIPRTPLSPDYFISSNNP